MSWFFAALAAQFALGSSAVIDKLLLKKSYPNPWGFTFWLGMIGGAGILLVPFGFITENAPVLVGLLAGATFLLALLFLYLALFEGEASNTLPLIGALAPIATLVWAWFLLGAGLNTLEFAAFGLLIVGGALLGVTEPKNVRFRVVLFALISSLLWGLTNTLAKAAFLETNFITAFVLIKIGAALMALGLLLAPAVRRRILHPHGADEFRNRWGYFLNRVWSGAGSILMYIAFSLGSPALVSSTVNLQYAFIFIGGWLLLKERFRGWVFVAKIVSLFFISLGVLLLGTLDYLKTHAPATDRPIAWGVTFSQKFSALMGFDWKENYDAIVDDLGAKRLRLVAYWDLIEPREGQFDFADLDYQMDKARDVGAKVVLAIGRKVPRWPECHEPRWLQDEKLNIKNEGLLGYMKIVIERYRSHPALLYWQIENEPFLPFGICPPFDVAFFRKEVALLKSLDAEHPLLITDSGELSLWYRAAATGDVFGTTMYRRVENRYFGNIDYNLPPEFFRLKETFSRFMAKKPDQKYLVIELGAEPWLHRQLYETDIRDQLAVFDLPFFKDTIRYANETGFDEYYLWGAEWWYWMKERHNQPEFWNYAKDVIKSTP